MGDVVNMNRFKKAKERAEKERVAATNRVKHGRTKAERENEASAQRRAREHLEGHRLDREPPEE